MLKLMLTPRSILDLEEIYAYTLSTWNLKQAEQYQDVLFESMQMISTNL